MDFILAVLIAVPLYTAVCAAIAAVRAMKAKTGEKKRNFKETFWRLFPEIFNPLNWFNLF